jgi:rhamnogalacturonyl hydrolase YesR
MGGFNQTFQTEDRRMGYAHTHPKNKEKQTHQVWVSTLMMAHYRGFYCASVNEKQKRFVGMA